MQFVFNFERNGYFIDCWYKGGSQVEIHTMASVATYLH